MGLYIVLIIVPILLGLWAQAKVSGTFGRYSRQLSRSGLTGAQVAALILKGSGIQDVEIVAVSGQLTDYYDPTRKRLALSSSVYGQRSVAALGVAAHEVGHAIQHQEGYAALKLRMSLIPVTNFASSLLPVVMIGGFFFNIFGLIKLGVAVYLVLTVFQLVTLPVEFDASRRAKQRLSQLGVIDSQEYVGIERVLNAAGYTYVAAFVSSLANLAYLFLLSRDRE